MSEEIEEGSPAPPLVYHENEKVLCFHGQLIYEGKVLGVEKVKSKETDQEELQYHLHYAGWSKKWDEYVPASRLLKYNEENLELKEKKKMLEASHVPKKSTPFSGTRKSVGTGNRKSVTLTAANIHGASGETPRQVDTDVSGASTPTTTMTDDDHVFSTERNKLQEPWQNAVPKRIRLHPEETKQAFDEAEFELLIPGKLKSILLDDYDRLKRRGMVVVLPARHSITEILDDFVRDLEEDQVTLQTLPLVETMRNNFRDRLEDQLLYDGFERKQFQQLVRRITENNKHDQDPLDITEFLPDIYGPLHFIRLCAKIGPIINLDPDADFTVDTFKKFLQDLYEYLVSRCDELFVPQSDYVYPTIIPPFTTVAKTGLDLSDSNDEDSM